MSLQITSMADVFTILLVFLLKGYASGAIVLQVEISQSFIQVGGVAVTPLKQFRLAPDASSLASALKKERTRRQIIAESNAEVENNGRLLLISDKRVPYGTLRAVMKVAAEQGFSDLKLAVLKE
ncbi:biopolymer transporter ExbD [Bdellovibrionota bacterium FG-2]